MLNWERIEAGEYATEDGRFEAYKTYDRIYGNHWVLHDKSEPDYYKSRYHENSFRDCKGVAESVIKQESEFRDGKPEQIPV